MGRLVQAAVLVTSMVAVANARPSRKVRVDSSPSGASVYIDSIDNGAACTSTPCTIDVPLGEATLIVRLDGYAPEFSQVDVTRGTKPLKVSVELTKSVGTIRIVGAPKGALIKVDDQDMGKVTSSPFELEVPAGSASVKVIAGGKTLATELVDVPAGDAVEVAVSGSTSTTVADTGEDEPVDDDPVDTGGEGGGSDDNPVDGGGEGSASETPAPKLPRIEAGLAFDVAFRSFEFSDGSSPFSNSGEVILGPAVELWPGRFAGIRALRGLSLFARVQFAATHQKVTRETNGMAVGAETLWGGLEVSLRQTWHFGAFGVQGNEGFMRDQVQFNADTVSALAMVPSADYKALRIGARVSYALGRVEPYVGAENRIVFSGGELEKRGNGAKATGYRAAIGAMTKLGPLGARVELSLGKYSWSYSGTGPSGARDKITYLSFLLGYQY